MSPLTSIGGEYVLFSGENVLFKVRNGGVNVLFSGVYVPIGGENVPLKKPKNNFPTYIRVRACVRK